MNDLIDRDALVHEILYGKDRPEINDGQDIADWQHKCIVDAPTVDAVPVVRCRECRHAKDHYVSTSGDKCCYCGQVAFTYGQHLDSVYMPVKHEDDFCSRGDKMDNGDK